MLEFWEIVLNKVVNNSTARLQELVDAIAAVDKEQKNLPKSNINKILNKKSKPSSGQRLIIHHS